MQCSEVETESVNWRSEKLKRQLAEEQKLTPGTVQQDVCGLVVIQQQQPPHNSLNSTPSCSPPTPSPQPSTSASSTTAANSLRYLPLNINGITSKRQPLKHFTQIHNTDLVLIQETKRLPQHHTPKLHRLHSTYDRLDDMGAMEALSPSLGKVFPSLIHPPKHPLHYPQTPPTP